MKTLAGKIIYWTLFLTCVFYGVSAFSASNTLKFVHISDVHLSDKSVDTSYKLLASTRKLFDDAIQQINAVGNLDFVFVTGDMTDRPKAEMIDEFDKKMNTLKEPWYCVFGNHDISIGGPISKKKYIEILRKNNRNFKFNKSYYSFVPKKGFRVIALDAVMEGIITANGKMPKEELCWLDSELAKAQKEGQMPLLFIHHPLHEPFSSFHHKILNSEEFYEVIKKYKMPMAIFSGHYHAAKVYKEGNIVHVSTPSLASYPNAFRVVTITNLNNKVIINLIYKETTLKEIQKKAKLLTFSSNLLNGEESDRNTTVVIDK